jgi:hypothetical protein
MSLAEALSRVGVAIALVQRDALLSAIERRDRPEVRRCAFEMLRGGTLDEESLSAAFDFFAHPQKSRTQATLRRHQAIAEWFSLVERMGGHSKTEAVIAEVAEFWGVSRTLVFEIRNKAKAKKASPAKRKAKASPAKR